MFWILPLDLLIDPQQQNSYSYARNNPINLSDPSGRSILDNAIKGIKNVWNNLFGNNKVNQPQVTAPTVNQQPTPKTTTWDTLTDKRIKTLDPRVQQPATDFINNTESQLGVKLRITEAYRTGAQQNLYYALSRTQEQLNAVGLSNIEARPDLPWATNATAGKSYHNYGRAFDVVRMTNGNANWTPVSEDIANIAQQQGFSWGAGFGDYPHFEMSFGQSINELYKSYGK